jgi:hypothetical protein
LRACSLAVSSAGELSKPALPRPAGRFDCDRHPHEPNQLAAICQHVLRQLVTEDRITPMSRNGLLLLIASLAFLVALGILTS